MEPIIYASIDLHYKTSTLGMMAGDGRFLGKKHFATSQKNLITHVRSIPGKKRLLTIEQGNQAHWAACVLAPHVEKLVICDPKANRSIYDGLIKNDGVDTQKLCELFRLGAIKPVYYASELGKRKLFLAQVKEYERIKKQLTINKNQFQASLRNWGYPIKITPTLYKHPRRVLDQIDREDLAGEFSRNLAIIRHFSDGRRTKHEKLAKTGHSSLKTATYQIWKAALRRHDDNEVKQFYHQSLERTENETNARLNTQRKIITSLWSLWKNNQPYRADNFLGSSPGKGESEL